MRYHKLLEQYKNGQLSREEREQVEQDIEKQDAISEYLTEQLEAEMENLDGADVKADGETYLRYESGRDKTDSESAADRQEKGGAGISLAAAKAGAPGKEDMEEAARFEEFVKKSIRKSFRRMGFAVGGIVLAVVLFVQFGLSPLLNQFYYDPTEKISAGHTGSEEYRFTNRMSRDFSVYSELCWPGNRRNTVNAVSQGYGNYMITISNTYSYGNRRTKAVGGFLQKGELVLYDPNCLDGEPSNIFACYRLDGTSSLTYEEQKAELDQQQGGDVITWEYSTLEEGKEALEELTDGKTYQAYVTLEKNTSFSEMVSLLEKVTEEGLVGGDIWLGVVCGESLGSSMLGYVYNSMQHNMVLTDSEREEYPMLSLYDGNSLEDYNTAEERLKDESAMTSHFDSMLKYLTDQKEFLHMMTGTAGMQEEYFVSYLKAAHAFVKGHGLTFYGFVCLADKEQMLKLYDTPGILAVARAAE